MKINLTLRVFIVWFCLIAASLNGHAFEENPLSADFTNNEQAYYCQDKYIGVQFLCDPDWIVQEHEMGTLFILISSEPEVTLTVIREGSDIVTLKDLTWPVLKEMGQYKEDFHMDYVEIAGREAINVEAIPMNNEEMRLSDFYVTRDGVLYSFLFAVHPKEHIGEFIPTIFNIVNSVEFLDEVNN